jgi:hypothetical protein
MISPKIIKTSGNIASIALNCYHNECTHVALKFNYGATPVQHEPPARRRCNTTRENRMSDWMEPQNEKLRPAEDRSIFSGIPPGIVFTSCFFGFFVVLLLLSKLLFGH